MDDPLFSAPSEGGQCISPVKNIDDPRINLYYRELQVQDYSNVDRHLTRGEFIKMVIHAAHIDTSKVTPSQRLHIASTFKDVDINSDLIPYIYFAYKNGIMSGQEIEDNSSSQQDTLTGNTNSTSTQDNTNTQEKTEGKKEEKKTLHIFRPNDTLSRAEAAKILTQVTLKSGSQLPETVTSFIDIPAHHTLGRFIQNAYDTCLLHGTNTRDGEVIPGEEGRKFSPVSSITLGETAKIHYNMAHHNNGKKKEEG